MTHLATGVFTPFKHSRAAHRSRRLRRIALALVGLATAFALLAALAALAATLADGPVRQVRADIEAEIGSGAYPQEVSRFYAARNFQPLWIETSAKRPYGSRLALRPEARRIAGLAQAAHEPAGAAAFRALAAADSRRPDALARAELATSAALGAYVRSLAPAGPEPLAFIDAELARPTDTGAVLYQAAAAPTVASYVAAVAEVNPVYRDLKAGLDRYRATWSPLPQTPIAPGPTLAEGAAGPRVDALRERLGLAPTAGLGAPFDAKLADMVRRFQNAHGLAPSGALDHATWESLNAGAAHYEALIAANLNRARALPPVVGGRFVLVNVAARQLQVYEAGQPAHAMRVIVGARDEPTPMMAGLLRYLVFNPYWNVPVDMVRTSIAPRVLSEGPGFLKRARMQVLSDWDDMPVEVDPRTVDWNGVSRGWQELRVRQFPGGDNMMGRIKFMAPNELGIYLHDTPHKAAFRGPDRLLSAGCVRLEAAEALASWLLGGSLPAPESVGTDREAYLPAPVPLYITYLTAAPGPGGVVFHPDVYGMDTPATRAMTPEAWTAAPFAPSPGVRRFTVGAREVLFCERRQQLFELDTAGAAIWDGLAAGRAVQAVAQALSDQGLPPSTTLALCLARAREWSEAGWLAPRELALRLDAPATHSLPLRLGPLNARLELRLQEPSLWAHVRDAFGQFARQGEATDELRLDVVALGPRFFLIRDGAPVSLLPAERVAPEVKALLTEAICGQPMHGGLWLHAALLSRGDGGLLLSGAPGAGKTTLAVALAMRNFGYASDDLVEVSREGQIRGVRFSPALKAGAWPLLAACAPTLGDLPIHLRGDGQEVRYLPAVQFSPCLDVPPRWALLLERQDGAQARLEPVDALTALTELLGSAYAAERRLAGDTLAALAERFTRMDCRRLVYSDLDDAARCVAGLTDG